MICFKVRQLLSAYIDSELSPDQMLEIRNHLFKCDACSLEYETLKESKDAFSSLQRVEPDQDLLKLIECKPWQLTERPSRQRIRPRWLVPALTLCLGMALIGARGMGPNGFLTRHISQDNGQMANSFKIEHERYETASPFSSNPGLDLVESGDDNQQIDGSTGDSFVVFVKETTVR